MGKIYSFIINLLNKEPSYEQDIKYFLKNKTMTFEEYQSEKDLDKWNDPHYCTSSSNTQ